MMSGVAGGVETNTGLGGVEAMKHKVQGLLAVLVLFFVSASARAELVADVQALLGDLDRQATAAAKVPGDRDAMAADIDNATALTADVTQFFKDRKHVRNYGDVAALDRKLVKADLGFKGVKLVKPKKGTGNVSTDANKYLTDYAQWQTLKDTVQQDLSAMASAATANDTAALTTATTAYFTDRRARFQALTNIVADIKAMKKDVKFKGTGKAVAPTGTTLHDLVQTFLNDRATWVSQQVPLDVARADIGSALSSSGEVAAAVTAFLTLRRAHHVQGAQLALDRKAMRAFVKSKGKDDTVPDVPKDDNGDEGSDALDQDGNSAGE
jgi:hypothetical protein